jgi:oligoribonuclease NrnB/cAMP/cGMP phosphodiesterase (DHH superfamily)
MICYHHNDLDGRCAAAIVLRAHPACKTREICYKDTPDFEKEVEQGEIVFIVDFSFKPEQMEQLFKRTSPLNIHWIDHHKTAQSYDYSFPASKLPGVRDFSTPGKSGCELAWEYFFEGKPLPEAVRLIGDYDTWRFETKKQTEFFYEGMKLLETAPKNHVWDTLLCFLAEDEEATTSVPQIMLNGRIAIKYRDNFCANYRQFFGWETIFEGHKCYVVNLYMIGIPGFGEKFDQYDICIACVYQAGKWTVSLYSKSVDVSIIAKKYGGGGHVGAAGFVVDALPF